MALSISLLIVFMFVVPCFPLFVVHSDLVYSVLGVLIFKMTFTIKGLERFG